MREGYALHLIILSVREGCALHPVFFQNKSPFPFRFVNAHRKENGLFFG